MLSGRRPSCNGWILLSAKDPARAYIQLFKPRQGRIPWHWPHSIRRTDGATVIDELERETSDIVLPKRRFRI
jgi:hypothetical protein